MFCFLLLNNSAEFNEQCIFNNSIIHDYLSFSSKSMIGLVSVFSLLMIRNYLTIQKINYFEYTLLLLFSLLGIFLICSSNDLITAYLSIELQSLAFYIMAAFKKDSTFSIDAGLKYFILGAFSSSLFLFGSSIIYGISGSTNFEDFKSLFFLSQIDDSTYVFYKEIVFDAGLMQFALVFIFVSLLFKLALAPFHLWSPDIYENSPTSSTFFFAVVPKLAIFVLLIRIFYYSFYAFIEKWRYYLVIIALLSVIIGSFAGLEQRKMKSLLAYSSIGHMGYTLIAFSTGTLEGFQALIGYLIFYMVSSLCIWSIFLLLQLKNNYSKKQNKDLADLVLLSKSNSILALFFATVLLSIAGLPPMVGFLVKLGIFLVSIEASMYFVGIVSILCSVISTFYYIRILKIMYFENTLVGKLYYPIKSHISILIVCLFYSLIFLFANPTLFYLFTYKMSILITI